MAKESVRNAVPMDKAKVRAIRMVQFASNGIPLEVCPRITSGKICGGPEGSNGSAGSGKAS
jgi:hypothetical protein